MLQTHRNRGVGANEFPNIPHEVLLRVACLESTMHERICVLTDIGDFGLVTSQLQEAGFNPLSSCNSSHILIAGVDQGYYIEVPAEEADDARAWLHSNDRAHQVWPLNVD